MGCQIAAKIEDLSHFPLQTHLIQLQQTIESITDGNRLQVLLLTSRGAHDAFSLEPGCSPALPVSLGKQRPFPLKMCRQDGQTSGVLTTLPPCFDTGFFLNCSGVVGSQATAGILPFTGLMSTLGSVLIKSRRNVSTTVQKGVG